MSYLLLCLALRSADAQLRPRRVGTNAMGEQQEAMAAAAAGSDGGGLDGFGGGDMAEALQAMAGALGGEGGGLDPEALLKGMDPANNPLLKGMAEANPELKELLQNPEALRGQMEAMAQMMQSGEGQEFAKKMMTEMQSVLT
jgi:hypothetical protein